MPILNIRSATREGAHLLIQCFGGPRSGKTYTALRLARGIAGPNGKIGFMDTESGRARLYSDKIAGGFFVGDLTPPFTPKRYRDAIEEFVAFGADVLVIDSFSHVWQGPGGVLELADQAEANGKKGLQKWLGPKTEYRKLVGFLLSTSIHIIFCSRAKQPVVEQTVNGRKELVTMPWEPVQDRLLKYEMTIVLPMLLDGTYETDPMRLKAPGDLLHLFDGQLLTEATGAAIAEWVAGGKPIDHSRELLRKRANDAATDGSDAFREFWKTIDRGQREALRASLDNLQSIAQEADAEKERQTAASREAAERTDPSLDDPFGSRAAQNSPAGDDGQSRHNHTDDERTIVGTQIDGTSKANHMPAGDTTQRPFATTDTAPPGDAGDNGASGMKDGAGRNAPMIASPSDDDLRIPLPDDADMPYVARTLLSLVAEGHDSDRIRLANAAAINRLRDQAPKLHDDVQAALDQRQGTLV